MPLHEPMVNRKYRRLSPAESQRFEEQWAIYGWRLLNRRKAELMCRPGFCEYFNKDPEKVLRKMLTVL